jgi:hypothetical protein
MKNVLFFACFCLFFTFCKKNSTPFNPIEVPPTPIDTIPIVSSEVIELGKASVLKNGVIWNVPFKAEYYGSKKDRFLLEGSYLNSSNQFEYDLYLHDIPLKIDKFRIQGFGGSNSDYVPGSIFGILHEGDQPVCSYLADTTRLENYIQIVKYDSLKQTVEGIFHVKMYRYSYDDYYSAQPDSITWSEGKFHLKLEN